MCYKYIISTGGADDGRGGCGRAAGRADPAVSRCDPQVPGKSHHSWNISNKVYYFWNVFNINNHTKSKLQVVQDGSSDRGPFFVAHVCHWQPLRTSMSTKSRSARLRPDEPPIPCTHAGTNIVPQCKNMDGILMHGVTYIRSEKLLLTLLTQLRVPLPPRWNFLEADVTIQ